MNAVEIIAIWGIVSLICAIAAGLIAGAKRRDHSAWAAWTFIFPPALLVLILTSRNRGARPVRPSFDQEDREAESS